MVAFQRYPDHCPSRKITPRLGLTFGSRSGLVLGLAGNKTIAPEEKCTPIRVRVWLRVSFGVEVQFSLGAIALEPFLTLCHDVNKIFQMCHINEMIRTIALDTTFMRRKTEDAY